ncbi:hypothetical protein [Streptomyces sp. NBC_00649]|uniref:hypothetical protein n=1 Tax=Streptomyces sp. NBC_00649 TaxID=2975798 RepID=UPI003252E415
MRTTREGIVEDDVGFALLIGCGSDQSISRPSNCVSSVSSPLEGFLGAGPNIRRSTSQSGTYRLDPKSARIPQREPAVQRRYGSAFRALGEAEAQALRLTETVRRMAEVAREGLGSGALEPGDE